MPATPSRLMALCACFKLTRSRSAGMRASITRRAHSLAPSVSDQIAHLGELTRVCQSQRTSLPKVHGVVLVSLRKLAQGQTLVHMPTRRHEHKHYHCRVSTTQQHDCQSTFTIPKGQASCGRRVSLLHTTPLPCESCTNWNEQPVQAWAHTAHAIRHW
jgi:hypothetical protein